MYAYQMDVHQPMSMYDAVRAEVVRTIGKEVPDGCVMHMVTEIPDGFRVTEVWESHELCDRFGDDVMRPTVMRVAGEQAESAPPPNEELTLHILRVAAAVPAAS